MNTNIASYVAVAVTAIVIVVAFIMLYRTEIIKNFQTFVQGNRHDVFDVKLTAPPLEKMFKLSDSEVASSFGKIKVIAASKTAEELKAMTDADIISPNESKALTNFDGQSSTAYQSNLRIFNNTDRDITVNTLTLRPFMTMNATGNFTSNKNITAYDCVILKKGEVTQFLFGSKFDRAVSDTANTFLASFGITDSQPEAAQKSP